MTARPPRLDPANAAALLEEARNHLIAANAAWRARDASDPGVVLLEAVATIVEREIDRINALPSAMETRFLELLGLPLRPGSATAAIVTFTLDSARESETRVEAGTHIVDQSGIGLTLLRSVEIPAGATQAAGIAAAVRIVPLSVVATVEADAEETELMPRWAQIDLPDRNLAGAPGDVSRVDVLVEWPGSPPAGASIQVVDGIAYVSYSEAAAEPALGQGSHFLVDRVAGRLRFPLSGSFVLPRGARISAAYAVLDPIETVPQEGSLTTMIPALPGVSVTNQNAAPGRAPQAAEQLIAAGPLSALTGGRVYQAADYQRMACALPNVARAHAYAAAEAWAFARPGSVNVHLAPHISRQSVGTLGPNGTRVTWYEALRAARDAPLSGRQILPAVKACLDAARPLGVTTGVDWLQAKPIGISCRIYVSPGQPHDDVEDRVRAKLDDFLAPVPGGSIWQDGWPLGRSLRQAEVIEVLQDVSGVRSVDQVEIRPRYPMTGQVSHLATDAVQDGVWYAVMDGVLYRTTTHGQGWTRQHVENSDLPVTAVAAHPLQGGLIAAALTDGSIYESRDCGSVFHPFATSRFAAETLTWVEGGERPRLLIGGAGDFCQSAGPGEDGAPCEATHLLTASDGPVGPVSAVGTLAEASGARLVAVARRGLEGVLLSNDSGWDGGFENVKLKGHDVRALALVHTDGQTWLIAGCARPVVGGQHAVMIAPVDVAMGQIGIWDAKNGVKGDWVPADLGWPGGGVNALAVHQGVLIAACSQGGLAYGTVSAEGAVHWKSAPEEAGLPLAPGSRMPAPVGCVAAARGRIAIGGQELIALTGPAADVFDFRFEDVGVRAGARVITIPLDWTLCGDVHAIEVEDVRH